MLILSTKTISSRSSVLTPPLDGSPIDGPPLDRPLLRRRAPELAERLGAGS
ncbi:hypothetical protein [Sorangium sp. So ce1078]|uniref:hypothetical protein n=1 Tax=Sorangium sp. So ce1078 TaxID=3133329 RepID=UPI003F641905